MASAAACAHGNAWLKPQAASQAAGVRTALVVQILSHGLCWEESVQLRMPKVVTVVCRIRATMQQ